jgi:hypothetical protein
MTEEDGPLDYRPQTILTFDIAGVLAFAPQSDRVKTYLFMLFLISSL